MEALISSTSQMQQQITMQTQIAVAKTALNTQKAIGQMVISLIDSASMATSPQGKSLETGRNIDVSG